VTGCDSAAAAMVHKAGIQAACWVLHRPRRTTWRSGCLLVLLKNPPRCAHVARPKMHMQAALTHPLVHSTKMLSDPCALLYCDPFPTPFCSPITSPAALLLLWCCSLCVAAAAQ
jgi:hypothetical protein